MWRGVALSVGFVLAALPGLAAECTPGSVEILLLQGGTARFTVEVVDTPETRARGLMFREKLARSSGMLFVYENPQRAVFWMKNTLIPLDMIFVDETGRIRKVHENAIPHDETGIDGGEGILVVLEINGGLADPMGIAPGAMLRHPAFEQSIAAAPCDDG
ncbi:MAG: DUF192 domain-containing protein [Pseudorhodobacter sp.]